MKIKNVSVKVIGVMGRDLMPDESMTCNASMLKNLAVDTMVKMGFLMVDDSAEKEAAMKEALRQQILKEQEEAAAKAKAEAEAAASANAEATADATPECEEAAGTKKTRRTAKIAE